MTSKTPNRANRVQVQELIKRVVQKDGPIRILIYRSASAMDFGGAANYVAHSVRYGQIAEAPTRDKALRSVIDQAVAYLKHVCELKSSPDGGYNGDDDTARLNLAPDEVLKAFTIAPRYNLPKDIREFFEIYVSEEYSDGVLEVHEMSPMQYDGEDLEATVGRLQGAVSHS